MMRSHHFVLLLLPLLILAARCRQQSFPAGTPFTLQLGEIAYLETDKEMTVRFQAVKEDSRCPKNVNCIWEGQAVVELDVAGQVLALTLRAGHEDQATQTVGRYTVTLLALNPYPEAGEKADTAKSSVEMVVRQ